MQNGRRPERLNLVPYEEFRTIVTTGMIGLVHEPSNHLGGGMHSVKRAIQRATESDYCHAFMAGWSLCDLPLSPRTLMLAESTGPYSQATSLRWRIKQQSGLIDFYRLRPEIAYTVDFGKAWWQMLHAAGQNYPESWIAKDLLAIATGIVVSPVENSDEQEFPRHCSGALHWALRTSGMTPLTEFDYLMFPGSGLPRFRGFADPTIVDYVGTPTFP